MEDLLGSERKGIGEHGSRIRTLRRSSRVVWHRGVVQRCLLRFGWPFFSPATNRKQRSEQSKLHVRVRIASNLPVLVE